MKYIIMCGGNYIDRFKEPKQLLKVNGEILVERIIRLLQENGIKDIAISTNNPKFDYLNIEKLRTQMEYFHNDPDRHKKSIKSWLNAYYPLKDPACYIHGDVYFSEQAIKTIVNTKVKDTMFFCTRDLCDGRPLGINCKGREPLAYKVQNQELFRKSINYLLDLIDLGRFNFDPISWNLYRKINNLSLDYNWFGSDIFSSNGDYVVIDDYTTDIDFKEDVFKIEEFIKIMKGEIKMIKVKVTEPFSLGAFREIKNLIRNDPQKNTDGILYLNDTFECTEKLAKYLTETNKLGRSFVEIIEIIPEEIDVKEKTEVKTKTTRTRKNKKS